MQRSGKKEYPEKAAQQNGKAGKESGDVCLRLSLRGKQRSENACPPDNRHWAGNGQNVTGYKWCIKKSVGLIFGCIGFAKKYFYAYGAQINKDDASGNT